MTEIAWIILQILLPTWICFQKGTLYFCTYTLSRLFGLSLYVDQKDRVTNLLFICPVAITQVRSLHVYVYLASAGLAMRGVDWCLEGIKEGALISVLKTQNTLEDPWAVLETLFEKVLLNDRLF